MSSCALPSSDSAKRALDGEANGVRDLALSTLLRSGLIAPGLMVVGIPPKKALLGSVVASIFITTFILAYMGAHKGAKRRVVRAARPALRGVSGALPSQHENTHRPLPRPRPVPLGQLRARPGAGGR